MAEREGGAPRLAPLPVDAALPALLAALEGGRNAVLVAPPGAGKTTRVPPALLDAAWARTGKIVVLEPRRLAARAAAARMARERGEEVGDTVGFRVRMQARVGPRTRIEVVTEGVFARMILADPGLDGVAAVLFDEFHERSLDGDLGLALALDAQGALRPDLRLVAMSATLDGARVAALLGDAPLIESAGKMFPVATRYLGRDARAPLEPQAADAVIKALRADPGSILVFLPGAREIRRTETLLRERLSDPSIILAPLYGAMDPAAQDRAIEPAPAGQRKIVLATSIAETSLTIEGVSVVVDAGLARVPRYDPATGFAGLATERVSQAAAEQRRGRAGRLGPGTCYRLWDEAETRALAPFARPEILEADLAPLALTLAEWGAADPAQLAWLDPPPAAAFAEARALLRELDALDEAGRITEQGRALARLPLPPRLAHMVLAAAARGEGALAARIAVLLTERGLGGTDADLRHRLERLAAERGGRGEDARRLAANWLRLAGGKEGGRIDLARAGAVLALAYPDRIARARPGRPGEFLVANGRGASLDPADALAREPYLALAEIAGNAARARIVLAAPIAEAEIEEEFAAHIVAEDEVAFDEDTGRVRARRLRRLGRLVLQESPLPEPDRAAIEAALLAALKKRGVAALPWTDALRQWRDRAQFLRSVQGGDWPDLSDAALAATLDDWLAPYLAGKRAVADLSADDLEAALTALLPPPLQRRVERDAPSHYETPAGRRVAIDYGAEGGPRIEVRVQEMFGLAQHPAIGGGRVPLTLALLSPAGRPVQVTRDLPGFWRGSYQAVRAELRGRYPKHPWPEDPLAAPPTLRAKKRS
ncbi:MAG TPA: ATP-dependent helicase HrpB [Alphaproteobacteria bacterium]|nr:ATP-dependent helicase HrpB [Alphaproteobacteria bacterium]